MAGGKGKPDQQKIAAPEVDKTPESDARLDGTAVKTTEVGLGDQRHV